MIHEVHLPRETRIYLRQIVRLQMGALSAVVGLHPGFSQAELQTALEAQRPTMRSAQVSGWIFGHQKPCDALRNFAQGSHSDKHALVTAMCQDVARLFWGCRDETLECRFDDDRRLPVYQKGAKDFLIAFYEQLGSGIDAQLFTRNPCAGRRKYGREEFFAAYEHENPGQYMCAICDEHRFRTILRGSYFSDIEHYFPKSIYPHLSCHPYNLIPICKQCNQAHLSRDPLQTHNGEPRMLGQVFLPYREESVFKTGVIRVDWNHPEHKPHLEPIQPRPDQNADVLAKFDAFQDIYDIPARWQGSIDQIGEQLWRRIRTYLKLHSNVLPNAQMLKTELEGLLSYLLEDLGKEPYDYVLIWYLANMIVEELEKPIDTGSEIPVLVTIQDILESSSIGQDPDEVLKIAREMYP